MAIERATARALPKPWGAEHLHPWNNAAHGGHAIGEIWYERPGNAALNPLLLLKLLFTSQPLSIQVHPDDGFAHSIGLPNGKTEAWYVLSAVPDAKVALGLSQRLTSQQLRAAIDNGSISDLVAWRRVSASDTILVPAGTIYTIGAGLIIAELQQRSDATFRLFDHGSERELHIDKAIVVADPGPADFQVQQNQLTVERRLLVSNPHFVFERIDLAPNTSWRLDADRETWLLVIDGSALAGSFEVAMGDALFAQSDHVDIHLGTASMVGLVAYTGGGPIPHLLRRLTQQGSIDVEQPREMQIAPSLTHAKAAPNNGHLETIK